MAERHEPEDERTGRQNQRDNGVLPLVEESQLAG
jgi:hypothetical protein